MSHQPSPISYCRVFLACPGDLPRERVAFPKIIAKADRLLAKSKGMLLEPLGGAPTWPAERRPPEKIKEEILKADLVVMLLWTRWESSPDQDTWAFEEQYGLASAQNREIWFYFRSIPDAMLADPGKQLKKVIEFRNKRETEKKFLVKRYEDEKDWQEKLFADLGRRLDGFPPELFNIDKLLEDAGRMQQLEIEPEKIPGEQFHRARTLAQEAEELAGRGLLTRAEESFAKAVAACPAPSIINSYGRFLMRTGALRKAAGKFTELNRLGKSLNDKYLQAVACGNLGVLARVRRDPRAAERMYRQCLAVEKELGRTEGMGAACANLGMLCQMRGDLEGAQNMYRQALVLEEEVGRKEGIARACGNLGILCQIREDLEGAQKMYHRALALEKELGRKEGMARAYGNLGILYKSKGDLEAAERMYLHSLALEEELGRREGVASDCGNLGNLYQLRGDVKAAEDMYLRSLTINEELGRKEGMAVQYGNLGVLYHAKGNLRGAAEMYKKSLAIHKHFGNKPMINRVNMLVKHLQNCMDKYGL